MSLARSFVFKTLMVLSMLACGEEQTLELPAAKCSLGARTVAFGLFSGDGCNQCECTQDPAVCSDGEPCQALCTGVLCTDANNQPIDVASAQPCTSQSDCAGVCLFDLGCGSPTGYCVEIQSVCSPAVPPTVSSEPGEPSFCGCDGVTYYSKCPSVPVKHAGECAS